jgi:acyl-CoA hydrolase
MDFAILTDRPLPEHVDPPADDVTHAIATNVASLIDDGATLQTGIGAIPAAVWNALRDKNDLGVHTEMFGDALIQAIDRGNVTGKCKTLDPGLVVATFVFGTRALYDRLHDNHAFRVMPTEYINDPMIIGQQDNMIAVNSAIEVDLTGQVCADSIGTRIYSGIGGQVDFMRGASRSRGGKPIIAMASTACRGTVSKIVSTLRPGAGVVTSRGDVHYVVTEHGIAYLHGKSLRERKERLIAIAAPEFHDGLRESWTEKGQG